VLGVAVIAPTLSAAVVIATKLHLFGWLDPWILGATPIAGLFLPLAWLVRRSRLDALFLHSTAEGLQVQIGKRSWPVTRELPLALAVNRLQLNDLDVRLEPLHLAELDRLKHTLLAHGHPVRRAPPLPDPVRALLEPT
jgi:hypothetical protein